MTFFNWLPLFIALVSSVFLISRKKTRYYGTVFLTLIVIIIASVIILFTTTNNLLKSYVVYGCLLICSIVLLKICFRIISESTKK